MRGAADVPPAGKALLSEFYLMPAPPAIRAAGQLNRIAWTCARHLSGCHWLAAIYTQALRTRRHPEDDLCAEPFRKSSFHPHGKPFSQNPPRTHPDSIACKAMLPIPRKLPAMAECRRYDICFSISFRLEASLIRFAGQISLTLRRTTDAVCSRTTVSGHRRFNGRGRPASSAEYRTCGRKAAAEKTLEAEKRPQNNCRASRIIN